jgi:hypothetical protein
VKVNKNVLMLLAVVFLLVVSACSKQAPATPTAGGKTPTPNAPGQPVDTQAEQKKIDQYTQQTTQALQSGDVAACAGITDERFRISCTDNVHLKTATDSLDINKCNEISTEGVRSSCMDAVNFKLAVQNKNAQYCTNIKELNMKTACQNMMRG